MYIYIYILLQSCKKKLALQKVSRLWYDEDHFEQTQGKAARLSTLVKYNSAYFNNFSISGTFKMSWSAQQE